MTLYLVVAPVKWTLSQIYEASSVALVSPLICAVLFEQSVKAFLTLWLTWIMLNRCGQALLVSSTTLSRSYNSVPAGLFIWIELLSCWPSLVSRPTDCRQCRSLLFAKAYLSNECMRLFPGLVSNLIHLREALKMCPLPSVTASLSKEITVPCYAKQKIYHLVEALQSCLHLRTTGSTKNEPRCIFKFPDELDQCTEPPLILGPLLCLLKSSPPPPIARFQRQTRL